MISREELIRTLELKSHPEGGWYKELYRSTEQIDESGLPERYGGPRVFATSIYYLLGPGDISAFHRLRSDETWYYHLGGTLELYTISAAGKLTSYIIGGNPLKGEKLQLTISAGTWFAARVSEGTEYTLVGASVSPGFEFNDFEMGNVGDLVKQFPDHAGLIRQLCRK